MSESIKSWWIIFYKDQLLLQKQNDRYSIPCSKQSPTCILPEITINQICTVDGHPCKAISIDQQPKESDKYVMIGLRESNDLIPFKLYQMAGKAAEILHWDRNSRFCPVCGTKMEQ